MITFLPYFITVLSYGTRKQNIPNMLTVSRLIFCFPFLICETVAVVYDYWMFHFVALFFLALCLPSDRLDGFLARRYGWVTAWGKKWDPIIDGVVITLINVYLIAFMLLTGFPYALLFSGLFVVIGIRNYIISQGFKYLFRVAKGSDLQKVKSMVENISHVTDWGKRSTAVQMIAIGFFFSLEGTLFQVITFTLTFACGFALSMFSGVDYGIKGIKIAKVLWREEIMPRQREIRFFISTFSWAKSILRMVARALPL